MSVHEGHYETLGVNREASRDRIRRAYRKLALKWHPDRNSSRNASKRFARIEEAYSVLIDPEQRKAYDLASAQDETIQDDDGSWAEQFASRISRDTAAKVATAGVRANGAAGQSGAKHAAPAAAAVGGGAAVGAPSQAPVRPHHVSGLDLLFATVVSFLLSTLGAIICGLIAGVAGFIICCVLAIPVEIGARIAGSATADDTILMTVLAIALTIGWSFGAVYGGAAAGRWMESAGVATVVTLAVILAGCGMLWGSWTSDYSHRSTIASLLAEGDRHRSEGRLEGAGNDNASATYLRVLELDPSNYQAKQGLALTNREYTVRAQQSAAANDFVQAEEWYVQARRFAASIESIPEMHGMVQAVFENRAGIYRRIDVTVDPRSWSAPVELPRHRYFKVYATGPFACMAGSQSFESPGAIVVHRERGDTMSLRFRASGSAPVSISIFLTTIEVPDDRGFMEQLNPYRGAPQRPYAKGELEVSPALPPRP